MCSKVFIKYLFYFYLTIIVCLPHGNFAKRMSENDVNILRTRTGDNIQNKQNSWEKSGQFEGDIIMTPLHRNGLIRESSRWPNNELVYTFANGHFTEKEQKWITQTLEQFRKLSCITPRPATYDDDDYVLVTGNQTGCFSYVGRVSGVQILNLQPNEIGKGCLGFGTILHEFLHALGFYHQQSSPNRDEYITIEWANIDTKHQQNFQKYGRDIVTDFDEVYDYDSILHYSAYAFSRNGKKTITPKDGKSSIGQRKGLSEVDIIKLNKMYDCTVNTVTKGNTQSDTFSTTIFTSLRRLLNILWIYFVKTVTLIFTLKC